MKENNELIAKFLGYSQPHPNYPTTTYWYKEGEEPLTILLFDTNWDWLMKAVHKCLGICHEKMLNEWEVFFSDKFFTCDIDVMFQAVVEFIKWYNENK